jgi:CubicO group peptidase (beta-lactamase class C family)
MIQSVTKIITATLVMQLVDETRIGLDDPVRNVLPGFRTADAEVSGQITVRHLLTHTGGFEGDLWSATTSGADALQRFVEDLISKAPQNIAPGEQFSYCSAGYGVLGRIVEVLRGGTFEDAVRRYLAEPLGIEELAFSADQALAFLTAIGHVRPDPASAQRPLRNWAVMPPSNPAAGNQLAMSARGLLAIARMHVVGGRAPDGTAVLSTASTRLMREPQIEHPGAIGTPSSHGLGWWLNRGGIVGHGGGAPGVASILRTAPEHGLAAVALTNGDTGGALIEDLLKLWFDDLAGATPATALPTPAAHQRLPDPGRYLGRYENRQHRYEFAHDDNGQLWLSDVPQRDSLEMAERAGILVSTKRHEVRPLSGDTFILLDAAAAGVGSVEFLGRDNDDRARFLFVGGRAAPRVD